MKTLLQAFVIGSLVLSALLGDFRMAEATQFYVRDNFSTVAYTNNNGSVNWAGPWVESNDDGTAGGGDIRITGGELRFDNRSNANTDESIVRNINLSNVNGAILSFDARTTNTEAGDTFEVAVYDSDTSTWAVLQTFDGVINDQAYYYDLTPYVSADTQLRFRITGAYTGTDEYAYLDDVQITYFTASSHTATDVRQTVQTYYIPVPEDQALLMMDTINSAANSPTSVYVSISVNADDTVIYFDHWEDDFELSVTDPTQSTTEVWGDNDFSNGAPPGYTTDVLNAGDIIILNNWVPTEHLDWIDFDGGDKIASTEAIAVTRTSWASGSGTLHGGSVEMLDTSVWGTRFDLPVHDTAYYDFTYTGVALMASEDGTLIYRNGTYVATLDEGESYLFNDTVAVGDIFTASAPVQANLLNGNIGSNYASDWLTLYPFDLLGTSYYAPVGPEGTVNTAVILHNPNAFQITVYWDTTAGAQTEQVIDAHQGKLVTMPTANSGAHFYTTSSEPPVFQAISTINSGGQANDWGYTLIPENQLTQQAMVGWGVGRDPTSATNPTENGSPVWLVAVGSGTMNICADYDGDGAGSLTDANGYRYDQLITLSNLARAKVYDSDGDQTGMLLYLCNGSEAGNVNKIAVAWGQDPAAASPGAPGLDVGTAVPPLPNFTAIKDAELVIDLNSNTRFDVRDTFAYDIVIKNTGALPVPSGSIVVSDIIPQYTTYVANSTTFFDGVTTVAIADNTASVTVFPLDEGGYTINQTLPIEGEFVVSFQVQIDPSLPGLTTIQNDARVSGLDLSYQPAVEIVVQPPQVTNAIGNRVWIDENGDGVQNPGEPGLPNVTVELYDASGTTLLDSVVTDANGTYLFPDLASGTYQVRVNTGSLPGGLSVSTLGSVGEDFNNQSQPYTVSVGGGENMTADFGYNWTPAGNVTGNTGTGAIGDRVWVDADGDGLQDPGEPGLGGATVRLLTDDNGDGIYGGAGDNPAITTTTDAAGNYIFANLPAGSYSVEVDTSSLPSGYAQTGDPDATCPGGGCDNRTTQPLVLAPGDVYLNADFGYQPTGASGAIGNTVWFNPNGNSTVDAGEYGIPGVSVALIQDSNGNGVWDAGEPIIATDITDSNGQYNFTGLPLDDGDGDADYLVWVNDTDNVLGELIPNYDADGLNNPASGLETTGISAAAVSAVSPTNTNQNFGYGPEAIAPAEVGVIGDTIFLDRNGNGSFDPGEGLENVEIELLSNLGTLIETTRTDENGHYAFGGVADGTYTIRVVQSTLPNGGAGLTNSIDPDTSAPGNSESSVTLAAGNRINLDQDFGYIASNPGAISGTLWVDSNADGTLTESGRFEGVTIALLDADGDVIATTTTDNAGNYSFPGLPAGTYTVHVTDAANVLEGYWQSPDIAPGTDGNSQSDPYTITLAAGESNSTADFGYYREPASVSDFVWDDLDQDGIQDPGEPGLPGVIVTLTIVYPNGATVTLVDVTDSNGAYLFDNLLLDEGFDGAGAGEPTYTVTFAAPSGYFPSPINQGGDDADSDGTTVTVTPVEGQDDTTVDSGFYAVVRIGDRLWYDWDGDGEQDSNEPGMAGVVVELDNGACTVGVDCPTATTDANGNYSFTDLPSGDYTVLVRASSLPAGIVQTGDPDATLDGQHTLNATAPGVYLDVDFGYQGTGSISDFVWNDLDGDGVQDAGEGGIGGVTVWVDLNNDGVQNATEPSAITDANGQYLISGLPAGTYTVRASGAPISGATATYDVDGGAVPASTPNVATVTLSAGQNRTDVDWGYQFTALSISKVSSAGGTVNPGDTINYTIIVRNNTAAQQTGIAITDALPEGATYVAQSTVVNGHKYYSDNLSGGYTGPTSPLSPNTWGSNWIEVDESDGPGNGDLRARTGDNACPGGDLTCLRVTGINTPLRRIYRQADLSGCTAATLSYRYNNIITSGSQAIRTYTGATLRRTLITYSNSNTGNSTASFALNTNELTTNFRISIDVVSNATNPNNRVYYDDVIIACSVTKDNILSGTYADLTNGAPPNLVVAGDGFVLNPGQQMQVTYQVTVDNPVQEASIDNTAAVISTQQTTPQTASTSDRLPPSALGDRVWLDRDNDGIQDADEPGIGGVKVTLTLSYPGGNTETFATFTDAAGNYSFANLYLNEAYTTAGATFSISFDAPTGASASPVAQGGNPAADSNGATTAPAPFYQGRTDITYDSGFYTQRLDLGDLPDTYKTRFSPGPAHLVFPDTDADGLPNAAGLRAAVWLGATIDVELDGTPTPDASGDGADEDGLVIPASLVTGEINNFTVTVNASATGTRVYYGLWIDWDVSDGVFFKSEDFYSGSGVTASPTPVTVPVLVPFDYSGGTVYVRVRAADSELVFSDATGTLTNGEVEDHYRESIPTAVTLAAFSATAESQAVRVTWETATELDNLGFNLYRGESPAGPWVKLNAELIPAQNPGASFGASYEWLDSEVKPNTTVYYRLEDVDVSGASTFHGPVSATVTGPTAVRIAEFGARGTAPAMLLLTLTTVAALAVQRKRRIAG